MYISIKILRAVSLFIIVINYLLSRASLQTTYSFRNDNIFSIIHRLTLINSLTKTLPDYFLPSTFFHHLSLKLCPLIFQNMSPNSEPHLSKLFSRVLIFISHCFSISILFLNQVYLKIAEIRKIKLQNLPKISKEMIFQNVILKW